VPPGHMQRSSPRPSTTRGTGHSPGRKRRRSGIAHVERAAQPAVAPGDAGTLTRALAEYVCAVADAVGVPLEGVTWEVTDTVTAYLALECRSPEHPDRDLMLTWTERQGWVVSVETTPGESRIAISDSLDDLIPRPEAVARFVVKSLAHHATKARAAVPPQVQRSKLAERMERSARER
jgi:hypothetical protein